MYLVCKTRPNFAFAIKRLNKYNTNPQKSYFKAARQVVCYLKISMQLKFIYKQHFDGNSPILLAPYKLIRYRDNKFARDPKDRKSVMRYWFFFNNIVVLWSNKKQRTVSTSITKLEYIAIGYEARENVCIKKFINKLSLKTIRLSLKSDNEANLNFTKNSKS